MIDGPARWAMIVPFKTLIDIAGDSDVVMSGIALASKNVHKSVSDSAHAATNSQELDLRDVRPRAR
jgi:hypothetical protein